MLDQQRCPVPCALVVTNAAGRPGQVVVVFAGPGEADEFARRHGLADWTVTPVRLAADMDDVRRQQWAYGGATR